VSAAVPMPQMTHVLVDVETSFRVSRFVPVHRSVDHSPPPLFIVNSSILI